MYEGFDTVELRDLHCRRPGRARTVSLPISAFLEDVSVGRDRRESSTDPRATRSHDARRADVDDLPTPRNSSAPSSRWRARRTIRVGGFRGGALPPSRRFARSAFAGTRLRREPRSGNVRSNPHQPGLDTADRLPSVPRRHATRGTRWPRQVDEQQKREGSRSTALWKARVAVVVGRSLLCVRHARSSPPSRTANSTRLQAPY